MNPEVNNLPAIKERWQGKLSFVGGMPNDLLVNGSKEAVEETVREFCENLAPGGGFVLGRSAGVLEGVLPQNYLAMIQAVHKYSYSG
jgi:uroporphyrinogen decarboxylase